MESNHQLELMRLLRYRFSNPLLNLYSCLASRLGFEPRMLILEIKVLPITLSRYTILERVIGVEPTTITLATWRSTSWATPACLYLLFLIVCKYYTIGQVRQDLLYILYRHAQSFWNFLCWQTSVAQFAYLQNLVPVWHADLLWWHIHITPGSGSALTRFGGPSESRTRLNGVTSRYTNRYTMGPKLGGEDWDRTNCDIRRKIYSLLPYHYGGFSMLEGWLRHCLI